MALDAAPAAPLDEARRLWRLAEKSERSEEAAAAAAAFRAYVTFAENSVRALEPDAAAQSTNLDTAAMALYKRGEVDLGLRAIAVGLELAPGMASLLHHKALLLIAANKSLDQVLPLLDAALKANPVDKATWATRGDALRLFDRPADAAEAYVRAQMLDPSSSQYVDRALKLVPDHAEALRLKVEYAQAHGGDRGALAALETLLKAAPNDIALHRTKAEILRALGEPDAALAALDGLPGVAGDLSVPILRAQILFQARRTEDAVRAVEALGAAPDATVASPAFLELAALASASPGAEATAVALRHRIAVADPRNLGNLIALRDLAMRTQRLDTAAEACRDILAVSPGNLEALRGIAELEMVSGRMDGALEAYRTLLAAHPGATDEARRALQAAESAGRAEAILEFSEKLLAVEPGDVGARKLRAETLAREGDVAGALEEYEAWIGQAPKDVEPRLAAKNLLLQLGALDRLPAVYDELFQLDPSRTDIALERGNLALRRSYDAPEGDPARTEAARTALVSYERAHGDEATRSLSLLGIARASRILNDNERAIGAYREFLGLSGGERRAEVHVELGHTLRDVGRLTEAEAEYASAIQLGLEESELLWNEVEVLTQLNQEAKAGRLVELLLQREPENPLYLRRRGQILLKTGHRSEGLAALKVAVEKAADDPHGLFEVAEALRAGGAYADSVGYYRQGLARDPKSRPGRLALAETLILAGQYPEAIGTLDVLLKEDANDARAWKARADGYRALGRSPEVLYSLKAILLLEPHNGPVLIEKARLHLERGERREALECLSDLARAGGPEARDGAVWLQVGDLAAELGETEQASAAFERAAQLDPSHAPEIELRRARLRLAAGRPDLALEVLDAAVPPSSGDRSISAILLRAEILNALERPSEAQREFEEVRQREPASPAALTGIARSLLEQGKHAEALTVLEAAVPKSAPQEPLFLLLAEAYGGTGDLPKAVGALRAGVQALPRSTALWGRLAEVHIARSEWAEASVAVGRAIALEPTSIPLLLRAGFVAERLGHPNEALAFYDRATEVAPSDKDAWCARGVALLATARPEEALRSFDRALALDSDLPAAKDGRKTALQRTREADIERLGREALLLEARLNRPLTRNDLFVTLHAPFEFLEPALAALSRTPKIDIAKLSEAELQDLESASYHLVCAALERRPEGIERRGLTLADVAVLTPNDYSLDRIQRLFGYLGAVLAADVRPENLKLAPDVEELARRALQLPEEQRSLFQLVRILRVGVYKARLIKAVEGVGEAGHAPLPAIDIGRYAPELRAGAEEEASDGSRFFASEARPAAAPKLSRAAAPVPSGRSGTGRSPGTPHGAPGAAPVRCVGCGGLASVEHACGATLCRSCLGTFRTCPKCQQAIVPTAIRALDAAAPPATPGGARSSAALHPKTTAPAHPKTTGEAAPVPAHAAGHTPVHPHSGPAPPAHGTGHVPAAHSPPAATSGPAPRAPRPTTEEPEPEEADEEPAPPERPPRPAHRADEEPRL